MTIGPVQLVVLGFDQPQFEGKIIAELRRLKDNDLVRVIDALAVYKDASGHATRLRGSQLSGEEAAEFGALVGALIGFGAGGEDGMAAGALAGAEVVAERGGVFGAKAWDVLTGLPDDSACALVLLEHRWAIPLRDGILRASGTSVVDAWIHPADLVAIGLEAGWSAAPAL